MTVCTLGQYLEIVLRFLYLQTEEGVKRYKCNALHNILPLKCNEVI